jgi:predicted metal-dependent hydrolase
VCGVAVNGCRELAGAGVNVCAVSSQTEAAPPRVQIRRSRRRRRTVSAYRDGDTVVVLMPAGLSAAAEQRHVDDLLARLERRQSRRHPSDEALAERASRLRSRYLPEAPLPASVRYVDNQQQRWGSCTPADRTIRITSRLAQLPTWVLDYVLVHELAHLLESGHGPTFRALVSRYPDHDRAVGYLQGYTAGQAEPRDRSADGPDAQPPELFCGEGGLGE